jgi:hypothetical protein
MINLACVISMLVSAHSLCISFHRQKIHTFLEDIRQINADTQ